MSRFACLLVLGSIAAPPAWGQDDPKQIAGQARSVLRHYCQRCHNGPGSESGYDFDVLSPSSLKEQKVIVPGKPGESELLQRILKNKMPPRNIPERPYAPDGEIVRKWIEAGAPDYPKEEGRKFISLESTLTMVRDHLRNAERADRPFLRYFTLTHLYNNPAVSNDDLLLYQAALSKALNSLHWKKAIVTPEPIDKEKTVFVVDVRKLDWDKYDLWHEIAVQYPYGLSYANHPNDALRRLDEDIHDMSKCGIAIIRADWFAATATRPPLYHTLLYDRFLPALLARKLDQAAAKQGDPYRMTGRDLYDYLGVDTAANFRDPTPERIARAGFAKSGVSGQNRMVERSQTKNGAIWGSADFKADNPRSKLTRFPLGPLDLFTKGRHPYERQAFVQDGGEIIFHLPNGLQGYMLVNGKDERIDEGPIQVVADVLKTSGTPAVVNGVSCMACHKHGMITFTDTIRVASAVFGDAEKKVRDLYPDKKVMDELVEQDKQQFLKALDDAVGKKFLRAGGNADKPIEEFTEPIAEIARLHRLGFLDLKAIACELYVEDPQDVIKAIGATELKRLGLEALTKNGGVIGRLEWETVDGNSLMQETARKLRYTPKSEE
jgi:hypothetical protein